MPICCHAEHDGRVLVLTQIKSLENAISLRCFFAEFGIGAAVGAPADGEDGFRLIVVGFSLEEFKARIAGANIELIG